VTLTFDSGSTGNQQLTARLRRTLPNDVTFTDTTAITFGGVTSPTFNTSTTKTFTSDSIACTIDSQHDTYIILTETSVTGGGSMGVFRETYITKCSGETANGTDYGTVSAIPNLTSLLGYLTTQSVLVSQVVIA
jgi:hypothetical protein